MRAPTGTGSKNLEWQSVGMTGLERRVCRLRVVHAHLLAGAEWRLHDPQRPLTHDRLLYVIQRPFGRITSMPATGHNRPYTGSLWLR
jgi:hypothetical protein